ncbi:hypothetical protein AVI53_02020 [Piscirickettsia salmonis]|nr:hypothetical protein PSLF89_05810 [Piscirickettsia salmonis LF-89 = ATCC VR-1361]ALY02761.1 hypothetical protein AWE47_07755 [Piscirickettsia salmonis]AMA42308.1 hypothetical protein AWJ11_07940 [Piscirickettsia salmonis]AOS34783.1 hypothetical protein AVM72_05100 [Piscirickettsia salmonis]APS59493.1 hypothetical protein AVI53_02020 [Piscirickettsia salmonis]
MTRTSVVGFMNMDLKSLNGYGPTSAKRVPPGGWMKHWLKLKGAGITFIERLINMAIDDGGRNKYLYHIELETKVSKGNHLKHFVLYFI